MTTFHQIADIIKSHKAEISQKYGVKSISVFGSYVRGEQRETSDVDILVDFDTPIGMFKFLELEEYLADLLKAKVDLVSKAALKPRIGGHILQEAKTV
jgi:uncharacterized protein